MADDERGVTLALLDAKLDTVIEKLAKICEDQDEQEERLRRVEQDQARMQERIGLVAGALAVLQFIGSAIAAWVGAMR